MSIITGPTGPNGEVFEIQGLRVEDLSYKSIVDYSPLPQSFNLSSTSKLVTLSVAQSNFRVLLQVKDPYLDQIISGQNISSPYFSGLNIDIYDENRNFVSNYKTTRNSNIVFSSDDFAVFMANHFNRDDINQYRNFFLDFNTLDYFGNVDTYSLRVSYPIADITGLDISETNPLQVKPLIENLKNLKRLSVYQLTGVDEGVPSELQFNSDFFSDTEPNENFLIEDLYYEYIEQSDVYSQGSVNEVSDLTNINIKVNPLYSGSYADGFYSNQTLYTTPFNLLFVATDYFSTGNYFISSGIKLSEYGYDLVPDKLKNVTGYITVDQNKYDKDLDAKAVLKWDAIHQKNALSFEAHVNEQGSENLSYVFETANKKVQYIDCVAHGTGDETIVNLKNNTYYSGSEPIFTAYEQSGIKWPDHTLYLDNFSSLPIGFYETGAKLKNITEVRIASGFSDQPELYFNFSYETGSNEFSILPSGGLHSGSIYTGTYSGAKYTGTYENLGDYGPSGFSGLSGYSPLKIDFETGLLFARRVTGSTGEINFILSEFEPKIEFDVKPNKNYEVKVRAAYEDGTASDFSDTFLFTSGQILNNVEEIFSGKYVVAGSGTSGFIPYFSGDDLII